MPETNDQKQSSANNVNNTQAKTFLIGIIDTKTRLHNSCLSHYRITTSFLQHLCKVDFNFESLIIKHELKDARLVPPKTDSY